MSDIEQKMALDASQALSTLQALDSGFKNFSSTLSSMGGSFGTFNSGSQGVEKTLRGIASASNRAAAAMAKLSTLKAPAASAPAAPVTNTQSLNAQLAAVTANYRNAGAASQQMGNQSSTAIAGATRSAGGFAISLETITRVISTQLIVKGLRAVQSAVEDSFQGFIKFNKALAEIQTIDTDSSLADLGKEVRALSDEFNLPLLDVAKAKYQVLSAGFTNAADQTAILTAAFKLSKTGISTAQEATDLMTGSLNAYGESAKKAGDVSGKMLQTIQSGKVIASELAQSLGKVAPIAQQMGVSLDEVLATFSSLTVGGVKSTEAATQIRASMIAMLKPSDAMREALGKLGVATGEQAVQAFGGYAGAMRAVIGTTDGSTTSVAKLYPNVRALVGVLRETGVAADTYVDHLAKVNKAGSALANKVYKARVEVDSENVDKSLTKIKNLFTVELGSKLVGGVNSFIKLAGGIDNVSGALEHIAPVAAAATVSLVAYGAAAGAVGVKNAILRNSTAGAATAFGRLNSVVGTALLALSAYEAGSFIGDKITHQLQAPQRAAEAASKKYIEDQAEVASRVASTAQAAENKRYAGVAATLAKISTLDTTRLNAAQSVADGLVKADKSAMQKIIAQHEQASQRERQAAEQAQQDITSSRRDAGTFANRLADQQFSYAGKRFSDLTKSSRDQQRALELSTQGKKLAGSGDKEASDIAFSRAAAFAQSAASEAEATGNVVAQANAEKTIEAILQKRIAAESAYQKTRQADAKKASADSSTSLARAEKLKGVAADFAKHTSGKDAEGNALTGKALIDNLALAKKDIDKFQKLGGATIPSLLATPKSLDALADQIQNSLKSHEFKIKLAAEHKDISDKISSTQRQSNADATVQAARDRARLSYITPKSTSEKAINAAQYALSPQPVGKISQDTAELAGLRADIQAAIRQPNLQPKTVNDLGARYNQILATATTSLGTTLGRTNVELDALKQVIQAQQQRQQPAAAQTPTPAAEADEPAPAEEKSRGGMAGYFAAGGRVDLGTQMPGPGYLFAGGYADGSALGMNSYLAKGGYPFSAGGYEAVGLAAGGVFKPRGSDTVPAMLTPGEFIVSAPNAKKFYSQLQSINAGKAPEYHAAGGKAGDTHVHAPITIHGGANHSPQQIAREVASHLKRLKRIN